MPIDINQVKGPKNKKQNIHITKKEELSIWKRDISFGKILTDKIKEKFYSELLILMNAGLDMKSAMDIIVLEEKNSKVKKIMNKVRERIVKGASFSEALGGYNEFTVYECFSVKIGEESGRMINILEELSMYFQKKIKQYKQLISAISYPAMIFLTALGAVFFMMNFIVPLFADAFKRFNSDLPVLTKVVINLSNLFRENWYLLPLCVVFLFLLYYSFRRKEWYRKSLSFIVFNLPVLGKLIQKNYLASFCQSMSLMTGAQIPLVKAIDLVNKMMGVYQYEEALCTIKVGLYHGKLLNEVMSEFKIFDSRMISLIKVGEETNRLEEIFKRLYDQYRDEAEYQTTMLSSMLEPILIIMVGGMVALILISMYLPMFKLGGALMSN